MSTVTIDQYRDLLSKWVEYSQKFLTTHDENNDLIIYGAGEHGHWGVHTHQKAFSAFAVMAKEMQLDNLSHLVNENYVLKQSIGMLRYSLNTHLSGEYNCLDGKKWGHNWIYSLGIERMMHGVLAIKEHLSEDDEIALKRVILSECDWLLNEYPIVAGLTENNRPESNIWNGAILLRAAHMYPDCTNRKLYLEKARVFFVNGISIENDLGNLKQYGSKNVADLFVGANFYNSYACNHHGYMNVGYMYICLSNIAMLYFHFLEYGWEVPDYVFHNAQELWNLVNTFTFDDGRLLRIGGDTRVRYSYCQDYALPTWLWAEHYLKESCSKFELGWLETLNMEVKTNGDGSFLSHRLANLENLSPVYYTRLESDRANCISMALYWRRISNFDKTTLTNKMSNWSDAYHGASFVQGINRGASFVWRAAEFPSALCYPVNSSDLVEWRSNLTGHIKGAGRINGETVGNHTNHQFDGGFLTSGYSSIYSDKFLAEGQKKEDYATKWIAFAALPDDATVLCIQRVMTKQRAFLTEVKGIHWCIPNDIFNKSYRDYYASKRTIRINRKQLSESLIPSIGNWINVDNKIGLCSLQQLNIHKPNIRQIRITGSEPYNTGSLFCDEICSDIDLTPRWYNASTEVYHSQYAIQVGNRTSTQKLVSSLKEFPNLPNGVLSVMVLGVDSKRYCLLFNTNERSSTINFSDTANVIAPIEKPIETSDFSLHSGEAILLCLK